MLCNKCQPFRGLVRHLYKAISCLIGEKYWLDLDLDSCRRFNRSSIDLALLHFHVLVYVNNFLCS